MWNHSPHPRGSGGLGRPRRRSLWIPAFAGMTIQLKKPMLSVGDGGAERFLRAAELAADQPRIKTVAGEQLGMGSGLDQPALVEHDQDIGVAHRREPVR